MSQFYCRESELRKLNKRYEGDKFECIVIYGRRRVGKTALINEFSKGKPTIFFSALNTTGKENLEALSKAIMTFERPDMESAPEFLPVSLSEAVCDSLKSAVEGNMLKLLPGIHQSDGFFISAFQKKE